MVSLCMRTWRQEGLSVPEPQTESEEHLSVSIHAQFDLDDLALLDVVINRWRRIKSPAFRLVSLGATTYRKRGKDS